MLARSALAAGLFAAALVATTQFAAAQTTFNVSTYVPYQHPLVSVGLVEWAELVEEESEGRIQINILETALGQPEAHYDLAVNGVADIALGIPGYTPGRFSIVEVAGVPHVGDTSRALSVALWRIYDAYEEMQEEFSQVEVLGLITTSPMHFFNSVHPIDTIDDFSGLKTRVAGGMMAEVARTLDVTPVLQPAGKTYELMDGGVIDAFIFPRETIKSFNLADMTSYATIIPGGLSAAPIFLVMNQDKFNGLSEEDQAALMRASGERLSRINGAVWDERDQEGIEELEAAGGLIETASDELLEDILEATQPAVDQWLDDVAEQTGADGAEILARFREEAAEVDSE